jgi:hypothetical protein
MTTNEIEEVDKAAFFDGLWSDSWSSSSSDAARFLSMTGRCDMQKFQKALFK